MPMMSMQNMGMPMMGGGGQIMMLPNGQFVVAAPQMGGMQGFQGGQNGQQMFCMPMMGQQGQQSQEGQKGS